MSCSFFSGSLPHSLVPFQCGWTSLQYFPLFLGDAALHRIRPLFFVEKGSWYWCGCVCCVLSQNSLSLASLFLLFTAAAVAGSLFSTKLEPRRTQSKAVSPCPFLQLIGFSVHSSFSSFSPSPSYSTVQASASFAQELSIAAYRADVNCFSSSHFPCAFRVASPRFYNRQPATGACFQRDFFASASHRALHLLLMPQLLHLVPLYCVRCNFSTLYHNYSNPFSLNTTGTIVE